jgi:hypothetical protein
MEVREGRRRWRFLNALGKGGLAIKNSEKEGKEQGPYHGELMVAEKGVPF